MNRKRWRRYSAKRRASARLLANIRLLNRLLIDAGQELL
jgi:hypothetical protein